MVNGAESRNKTGITWCNVSFDTRRFSVYFSCPSWETEWWESEIDGIVAWGPFPRPLSRDYRQPLEMSGVIFLSWRYLWSHESFPALVESIKAFIRLKRFHLLTEQHKICKFGLCIWREILARLFVAQPCLYPCRRQMNARSSNMLVAKVQMQRTWVDLTVRSNTIGIHEALETLREFVGSVVSRRCLFCHHAIQNRWNTASTPFLQTVETQWIQQFESRTSLPTSYEPACTKSSQRALCNSNTHFLCKSFWWETSARFSVENPKCSTECSSIATFIIFCEQEHKSQLTVPRLRASWILSRSFTGHQHSAIRHFCVTSKLNMFNVW